MAVTYTTIPPPEHLSTYVRFFWVLESDEAYTHRQMADISPELIFHYNGQSSSISRFTIDRGFGIFGVYLYPYAIPSFLDMNTFELTNQMSDLQSLWGNEGTQLEEKMCTATDNHARLQLIIDFLSRKLLSKGNEHPAIVNTVQYILETKGTITVETLASNCGLSERQFGRIFKRYTGFTPKLFSRITRFHSATQQYGGDDRSLTEIALDCGYYDQSHFIQDFKEFAGCLPSDFFTGEAEGIEWRNG